MSKLQHGTTEELQAIRQESIAHFAPILLREALVRLRRACGADGLDRYEKAVARNIEMASHDNPDFEDMKEFAFEHLHVCLRDVKASDDVAPFEDVQARRTQGRSEEPETLENQLQKGLEDSFPASDPPAVVSTAISGGSKNLVGTDEVLRQRKKGQDASG